ncbi:hypothetical protein [Bradyrhizobium sp. I1.7.5]|uniref:hypothetical protein n=1 Tax=Bradyrhizobium sp. I1.7.5 TaxID=3156363 RepID=UPI003397FCFE
MDAVEQILVADYPNGLWAAKNNIPLLRRGITASHPALDFEVNGVPTVVDIACFSGSSGSPLVCVRQQPYRVKSAGAIELGTTKMILLGVLYSGPVFQPNGSIVARNIPTASVPVPAVNMMMNLGYIIKAGDVPIAVELRRADVAGMNVTRPS